MKVFLIISDLAFSGTGRQLALLASGLPRDQFDIHVGVLGPDGPLGESLRSAGVEFTPLGWTRLIDARPVWRLRQLVKAIRPEVIHAWGLTALRASLTIGDQPRLLVSTGNLPRGNPIRANVLDRWVLHRTDRVVARNPIEVHSYEQLGVAREKICVIAPGVSSEESPGVDSRAFRLAHHLPENARLLIGVGPLERDKGFHDAIWAFDILKHLYDDLHLILIGEGSDQARLEQFARSIAVLDHVHLVGRQARVSEWLAQAEVVWSPSLAECGAIVALEAMAAGRAVVASELPGLAGIVVDGETGYLVPPGNKPALARQTRLLLENSAQRQQFGNAGRRRASRQFAAADMVRRHIELYQSAHA
jgi:glycosyltransferase involved in cell wall biosynthesis